MEDPTPASWGEGLMQRENARHVGRARSGEDTQTEAIKWLTRRLDVLHRSPLFQGGGTILFSPRFPHRPEALRK